HHQRRGHTCGGHPHRDRAYPTPATPGRSRPRLTPVRPHVLNRRHAFRLSDDFPYGRPEFRGANLAQRQPAVRQNEFPPEVLPIERTAHPGENLFQSRPLDTGDAFRTHAFSLPTGCRNSSRHPGPIRDLRVHPVRNDPVGATLGHQPREVATPGGTELAHGPPLAHAALRDDAVRVVPQGSRYRVSRDDADQGTRNERRGVVQTDIRGTGRSSGNGGHGHVSFPFRKEPWPFRGPAWHIGVREWRPASRAPFVVTRVPEDPYLTGATLPTRVAPRGVSLGATAGRVPPCATFPDTVPSANDPTDAALRSSRRTAPGMIRPASMSSARCAARSASRFSQ